jgi:pyruvate-ferredoxin/flavodoxin oxidoreductase
MFDFDYPAMLGVVQNQDSYAQGVAAQRPFYFDHVAELTDRAMAEYAALTGRAYARVAGYRWTTPSTCSPARAPSCRTWRPLPTTCAPTRGLKVGVLNMTMFRPFPADLITACCAAARA